jgi:hypothetical protein
VPPIPYQATTYDHPADDGSDLPVRSNERRFGLPRTGRAKRKVVIKVR